MQIANYFSTKQDLGKFGEDLVVIFLRASGYVIVNRRYRGMGFEIDVLAWKEQTLFAIEVKSTLVKFEKVEDEYVSDRQLRNYYKGLRHFTHKNSSWRETNVVVGACRIHITGGGREVLIVMRLFT